MGELAVGEDKDRETEGVTKSFPSVMVLALFKGLSQSFYQGPVRQVEKARSSPSQTLGS